ncbi:unnamed protein product [Protopolystoma xenopodis]|uniref:Uncharacterized protein n=1 Tax=Protopolystoma xenopodis TaxID=117903 RepID=A0A448X646_9PLAT|nr:unnamed protein product [Protopolystoma xenopodis]
MRRENYHLLRLNLSKNRIGAYGGRSLAASLSACLPVWLNLLFLVSPVPTTATPTTFFLVPLKPCLVNNHFGP